jgi:hypothetical protein
LELNNEMRIIDILDKIPFLLMVAIIISAFFAYSNIKLKEDKSDWYFELLGPIIVLCSEKYLNERGKKWRKVFIFSLLLFILMINLT